VVFPRLLVLVALLAAAFGASLGSPAHADTDGAAMSLSVDPADTIPCPEGKEPSGSEPLFCVPSDTLFTLQVFAVGIPPDGYSVAQAWVAYGDELGDQNANGAVKDEAAVWPDCGLDNFQTTNTNQVGDGRLDSWSGGCLIDLIGPPFQTSMHTGVIYEIELTCDSNSHVVDLIPAGQPPAGSSGSQYYDIQGDPVIPQLVGAEVNCGGTSVGGVALGDGLAPLGTESGGVSVWWFAAAALAVAVACVAGAITAVRRA